MAEIKIGIPSGLTKSPITTMWGLIQAAALAVIIMQLGGDTEAIEQLAAIDSPEFDAIREQMIVSGDSGGGMPSWAITLAFIAAPAAAALQGIFARDNGVPSEKAGASSAP